MHAELAATITYRCFECFFFYSSVCISDVAVCEMTTCNTWGLEEVPTKHMEVFRSLQIYIHPCLEMTCVKEADGQVIRRRIFCSSHKLPSFL